MINIPKDSICFEPIIEGNNIETTVLPLLSICSMTSDYQKKVSQKSNPIEYSLLNSTAELPDEKTPQLLRLIEECQECFEKEARLLIQNDLSMTDVEVLFSRYKQFLVGTYILKSEFYDPHNELNLNTSDKSWFFDETSALEDISPNSNASSSYNDFDIDNATTSLASDLLDEISPNPLEFGNFQLYDETTSLYPETFFLSDGRTSHSYTTENEPRTSLFPTNDTNIAPKITTQFVNGKRSRITKETKSMLEAIFSVKPSPNNAERRLIANKCNLSPSQVRIWFTNTRARRKVKSPITHIST